jgi:hypothetical protein
MAEVPRDEVVDLVKRRQGDVDRVGEKLSVDDAARDIALGKDRDLFGQFQFRQRVNEFEVTGAMRLRDMLEFAANERRGVRSVLAQFAFKPADGEVASERIVVVEICSDDRGFEVKR